MHFLESKSFFLTPGQRRSRRGLAGSGRPSGPCCKFSTFFVSIFALFFLIHGVSIMQHVPERDEGSPAEDLLGVLLA